MTLISSLLIYAGGDIAYVDALFLGAGSCTQAGLNPIDIDLLNGWQQVLRNSKYSQLTIRRCVYSSLLVRVMLS